MVRWVVSVMVGVVVLAAARPALAGTYEVNACAGGSVNRSWVASNSNDAAFDVKPGCPFEVYSAVTAGARAGFFEAAWWRLTAPPGTVIDRLRLARYGYRFVDEADRPVGGQPQGGWTAGAYVVDSGAAKPIAGEDCTVQPGAYLCDFGSKNTSAPVDLDLDATQVTYQVACVREGGTCKSESDGFPLAGMTIFNAVATVRDDTAPKLSAGGPLLAGGWHRPDEEVGLDASDATGISAAVASAGAGTGALATPCDFTQMVPCANVKSGAIRLTGLADGRQSLTITVKDAAGNPATATALANGRLTTTLPAKLARGAQVTLSVSDNAGNSAAGVPARLEIGERVKARNGRAVTLRGRLLTPAGGAIANVPVVATATISRRGATAEPAGTVTTDARGRFVLRLPAGPSRTVRLTVNGGGGLLGLVRAVAVRVPATSTIRASRRTVSAGTRVTFSGRIRAAGQRLPSRGLIVVVQGRSAGAWRTFADTRTTSSGRWSASYRFRGVPGRYPVRLRIRRASGFPFELGYSPTVSVRVR